jgi:hypothetical protein
MNQRQYLVNQLQTLNLSQPMEAFTTHELYADMPADVRADLFSKGVTAIGKVLDVLRRNGIVANGESEYKNGKSVLTWRIHPKYSNADIVEDEQPEQDAAAPEAETPTPEAETPTPEAETPTPEAELQTPEASFEEAVADLDNPDKWQAVEIDATILDTNDQLEAALVDLIKQHRAYKTQPSKPTLNSPAEKRQILALLADSVLVNPEFKTHLVELREYVEQWECAA